MQDVVERIWDFIDDFNINSVLKFLKDNIVGTVVVVSLIFWVPISCLISYVDNKRAKKVTFYVKSILANLKSLWRIFFLSGWRRMGMENSRRAYPSVRSPQDHSRQSTTTIKWSKWTYFLWKCLCRRSLQTDQNHANSISTLTTTFLYYNFEISNMLVIHVS